MFRKVTFLGSVVAIVVAILVPAVAQDMSPQEKAVEARRGYMKLVVWEAGPLFGMAKGAMDYSAETAQAKADALKALTGYPIESLFMKGTSKSDLPGKTRTEMKAWEDMAGFEAAFAKWRDAVDNLQKEAGKGQAELAAAVGMLGGSCGGCHKPYRAEDF